MIETREIIFVSQAANLFGSERTLLTLLEGEFPAGFRPVVVCPASGPLCAALDALRVERIPWEFNCVALLRGIRWNWKFFRKFRRLLRSRKPKAVVLVYEGNVPLLVVSCLSCGVPVLRILQRPVPAPRSKLRALFSPDRLAFRYCQGVFCGANTLRIQLKQNYRLSSRPPVTLVYLPVRTSAPTIGSVTGWRARLGIPLDSKLIGQFGRIHPDKGVDTTLKAAKLLQGAFPDAWLVIVGGSDGGAVAGEYEAQLHTLEASLDLRGRVVFTGTLNDIFTGMAACDIVVQPSRSEGVGIACLEAMLLERPVVGSLVDGLGELLLESGGGVGIPAGSEIALSLAISNLLRDPQKRISLGQQGKSWVLDHCAPALFRQNFWAAFFSFLVSAGVST